MSTGEDGVRGPDGPVHPSVADPFTKAARAEAERYFADPGVDPLTLSVIDHAMHLAEWARTHLAAEVRKAKAEAWDEGRELGFYEGDRQWSLIGTPDTPNPYRAARREEETKPS